MPSLTDFKKIGAFKVLKDAPFKTLGFLSDPQPGMLTFLEDERYLPQLASLKGASCILSKKEWAGKLKNLRGIAISPNPRLSFFKLHNHLADTSFYWKNFPTQIHPKAKIHPRAVVASHNVRIGAGSMVEAGAIISERCVIGQNIRIMCGAVLGSVGLQVSRFGNTLMDMTHAGGIRIAEGAIIMANAVIANAVFNQWTTIGKGCRIGNLAFVSHHVEMQPGCMIGHGSIINGNVKIGENAWIGPSCVISNNLQIHRDAYVCLGSTVIHDVAPGQKVIGSVALDKKIMMKHIHSLKNSNV